MNRIDAAFARLRAERRSGFIAYLTAGDPSPALTIPFVRALEANGADIVELGVPFSDPLADGVVNQRSAERALRRGVTLKTVLGLVARLRKESEIPVVLFTYLNPVYAYGFERFASDASRAGVDGVLSLDLPPEEASEYEAVLAARGIRTIFLVAPTTPPARLRLIAAHARGFIYCVSRTGVTGGRGGLVPGLAARLRAIRRVTRTPVAVGFGVSTPGQVAEAARMADAVVVGSALVKEIERGGPGIAARIGSKARRLTAPLRR
jgi:tryptophan synthase alpha chain